MLTTNKNIINQKANNTPSNSKLLLISTKQNHQSDKEIENKINFLKIHQMKLNFIKKQPHIQLFAVMPVIILVKK